jgi:hypothetical protein
MVRQLSGERVPYPPSRLPVVRDIAPAPDHALIQEEIPDLG